MASVCFYFQLHQPRRLRRYSVFDAGEQYYDDEANQRIVRKVTEKCYVPATSLLLKLIDRHAGKFRAAFSLTGSVVEQLQRDAPQVIEQFRKLAATGCVEFLGETYYHSLAFLYSRDEFDQQVDLHAAMIRNLFGQSPRIFRNTELIYNNDLASHVAKMGYAGVLAEGADRVLEGRSPNAVYHAATPDVVPGLPHIAPGLPGEGAKHATCSPDKPGAIRVLLKNYRLSDDIAFRFSNRDWPGWPVTPEKFTQAVRVSASGGGGGDVCNLFMDFETFGEHQWSDTGIFDFLEKLPGELLNAGCDFVTPSEAIERYQPADTYHAPQVTSWADTERDLSAWAGNAMQASALKDLYDLEQPIKAADDPALLADWRQLTTSDHFYYMCTKYFGDQAVHRYFNPYQSPYDAYINFMNVLDNLRSRADGSIA